MPSIPNRPNLPGGGWRQQRAAQLRSEAEAEERIQRAPAEGQAGLGNDRLHCVQEGESLESIADSYDCSPESIRNHPSNAELSAQDDDACTLTPGDNVYIPAEDEQPPTPVGQGDHVVKQGECISSIAKNTGHFWETIWNDPANAEFKEVRGNPNILLPGDRVTIPEKRRKQEPRETEQRHRFVRRGEPTRLRMQILGDATEARGPGPLGDGTADVGQEATIDEDFDEALQEAIDQAAHESDTYGARTRTAQHAPRANAPYVMTIDNETFEGMTDANGCLEVLVPGNAKRAKLFVGEEPNRTEYELALGGVDPITELSGVQHRLRNLGCNPGPTDGRLGPTTRAALRRFQQRHQLPESGEPDHQTRDKLVEDHGS